MTMKSRHYWRNLTLFALAIVLLVISAGTLGAAYTGAMILVHPGRTQPTRTPADWGVKRWEEVRFAASDGLQLEGWFIPPDPRGDRATLIFVHGLNANRGELLDEAVMLAAHGYGALLLDLRNHGRSQGTITTLGYSEVEDVRGAMDYLLTRPEVNPERIGLVGNSMGGATVIRAAARISQARVVVAQSAFASLTDDVAQGVRTLAGLPSFPFAPLIVWLGECETGVNLRQVRPIDDVGQIAPRAILFIHGEQDATIHVSNSLRLYQAAGEPKALYLIPGAGHGELLEADPIEFERRVVGFLDAYFRER
jgi:dipeptidyl aminopeptidase/acylaminoacyl peptidase